MNWLERKLAGSVSFKLFSWRVVIYGFNAMHVAINISTQRWGYICFHPTMYCFKTWWPWEFYLSPNATPWYSTFAIGPGISDVEKVMAGIRRYAFGHNFIGSDEVHDWCIEVRDKLEHLHYLNHNREFRESYLEGLEVE